MEGFQPPMMSFKNFLSTQDDTITDEEAIKKYAEYKLEFQRQQLNEFFVTHKDEEWFKLKYHPEDGVKRKEELRAMLKRRVEVFQEFMDAGKMEGLTIDGDKQESLIRLLDSVVIKLEGGSDYDLAALDIPERDEKEEKKGKRRSSRDGKDVKREDVIENEQSTELRKAKELLQFLEPKKESESESGNKRKREGSDNEEDKNDEIIEEKETEKTEKESREVAVSEETGKADELDAISDGEGPGKDDDEKIAEPEEDKPKPRALHKTSSIFLRNLAPTITKQEVEAMCKRYDGFLRASVADPAPDRRWFRRGWVTFERSVKIKEICFALNNIRLRDCELGPIVNRDLSRRVRTVNGVTIDKKIVRNDIKLAAKIITNLDKRWGLWVKDTENAPAKEDSFGLESANPLLSNITDYLIEEASAEEEELLGKGNEDGEAGDVGETITRDDDLIAVLDKLIFYLRVVHSVDFYNHSEYPNEDEMPNRCGIMHARGIPPTGKINPTEIEEYCTTFEKKMGGFLIPRQDLSDEEAAKIGMKNEEDEVEKFMAANTQELGKDKWLCPLSGKKFKGPDFVRKHIINKHAEKIDAVRNEVKYFNNYLKDPKRPQLPENPINKPGAARPPPQLDHGRGREEMGRGGDPYAYSGPSREPTKYPVYGERRGEDRSFSEPRFDRGFRGPPRREPLPPMRGNRGLDSFSNRPIITYRDWDAPAEDY